MIKKIEINNIKVLVKSIVKKSFPALRGIKILVIEKKRGKHSAMVRKNWNQYTMFINKEYLKIYDKKEIKGLIAHELSHIEEWVVKGVWFYIINSLKCSFSKKYNAFYEREIDKIAICKGYRKELKAQRSKRETQKDRNYYRNLKFYLTPEEIEKVNCYKKGKS